MDVAQEKLAAPLVLLVAAGGAPDEVGLAVAQRHADRERRARTLARRQRGGEPLLQPEHLAARAEREAEVGNDRRGLQPSARWRRREHVAVLVDDVEVAGVAAHLSAFRRGGLVG